MEATRTQSDRRELFVRYFARRVVGAGVERSLDLQAVGRRRVRDQADNGLHAVQRASSPVLGNEGKHSMLDLVPLARSGWIVSYADEQAGVIG